MKYINLFLCGFIVLWLNQSASTSDRQAVRAKLNAMFNEPNQENYVEWGQLPVYRSTANTNVTGWLLVVDEAQLTNLKVDLDNVTPSKFDAWKSANMQNPNHLRAARGDSWEAVVASNGLERVP